MDYKTRKALDLCLREEYSLAYPRPHLALDAPRILTPCLPPQAVGFLMPLSFQMQGSRAHNTGELEKSTNSLVIGKNQRESDQTTEGWSAVCCLLVAKFPSSTNRCTHWDPDSPSILFSIRVLYFILFCLMTTAFQGQQTPRMIHCTPNEQQRWAMGQEATCLPSQALPMPRTVSHEEEDHPLLAELPSLWQCGWREAFAPLFIFSLGWL